MGQQKSKDTSSSSPSSSSSYRRRVPGINEDLMDRMICVGAVDKNVARVWARVPEPGKYRLTWEKEDEEKGAAEEDFDKYEGGAVDFEVSQDDDSDFTHCVNISPLIPNTRYHCEVISPDGETMGTAEFGTSPEGWEENQTYSYGFTSCNQPFDKKGKYSTDGINMQRATYQVVEENDISRVFLMGDQMYADMPEGISLFDEDYFKQLGIEDVETVREMDVPKVRRMYQERYRAFYSSPEWRKLLSRVPTYPIWDDHEIVDNWGSILDHQKSYWKTVGEGARQACYDYQSNRILEKTESGLLPSFQFDMEHGPVAAFVPDLRTQRTGGDGGHLLGDDQLDALRDFLLRRKNKPVLFLGLSVPILHLSKTMSKIASKIIPANEDFSDRWSSRGHVRDRDRVLKMLRENSRKHPEQKVFILSGDIHIGCAHQICFNNGGSPVYQFVSSAITHNPGLLTARLSKALIKANKRFVSEDGDLAGKISLIPGVNKRTANPFGKLNFGVVEVKTFSKNRAPLVKFKLFGHKQGRPVCVYESPDL